VSACSACTAAGWLKPDAGSGAVRVVAPAGEPVKVAASPAAATMATVPADVSHFKTTSPHGVVAVGRSDRFIGKFCPMPDAFQPFQPAGTAWNSRTPTDLRRFGSYQIAAQVVVLRANLGGLSFRTPFQRAVNPNDWLAPGLITAFEDVLVSIVRGPFCSFTLPADAVITWPFA
jgi:hypothetical protein